MAKKKIFRETVPVSVVKKLSELEILRKDQLDLASRIMKAFGGAMYPMDLYIIGALNRSLHLIPGFNNLVREGNYMCAIPLVRLQMDSVMRVSAMWIVREPHDVVGKVWKGERLKNIKTMDGKNNLTDAYLHTRLTEEYPYFSKVYNETSGFVHLSKRHINSQFERIKSEEERRVSIKIGSPTISDWPEKDMLETVDAFIAVTKLLNHYCEGWRYTKDNPPNRAEKS